MSRTFEQHVDKVQQLYQIPKDKVLNRLWPGFDIEQQGNHEQVSANLAGYQIKVDVKLAPLLERINSGFKFPITAMSCQHGWFGNAGVTFTYEGFYQFYHKVRNQYLRRYGGDGQHDGLIVGFYHRIVYPDKKESEFKFDPQLTTSGGEWLTIDWRFRNSDIESLTREYDELFTEPKNLAENHDYLNWVVDFLETFKDPSYIFVKQLRVPGMINLTEINRANVESSYGWKACVVWNGLNEAKIVAGGYELKPNQVPPVLAVFHFV